jgi:hypothetical protein
MIDPKLHALLEAENCYSDIQEIPEQGICAIEQMMPKYWALHFGLTATGREGHYSFNSYEDAYKALTEWNGVGDPGNDWLKYKCSSKGDYSNPLKFPMSIVFYTLKILPGGPIMNEVIDCIFLAVGGETTMVTNIKVDFPYCNYYLYTLSGYLKDEAKVRKALADAGLLYTEPLEKQQYFMVFARNGLHYPGMHQIEKEGVDYAIECIERYSLEDDLFVFCYQPKGMLPGIRFVVSVVSPEKKVQG